MIRLTLVLFLFVFGERGLSFDEPIVYPSKPIEREQHFRYVYEHIRRIEGTYVNHWADRGGETYGGISRRLHPDWYGWTYIDRAKPLERYDSVPPAEFWAMDFYLDLWVSEGFEIIEDRNVALNLFDFRIHSSPRTVTKLTNRVLVQMGCKPVIFGRDWIDNRFNRVDPDEFVALLKKQRLYLFHYLVNKDPDQRVFLDGWKNRLENI